MKHIGKAFTLVELVVVLTILTLLASVGFVGYTGNLETARDSSRVQQMTEIHKGLTLYATRSKLPTPWNAIEIFSWDLQIGLQWYADRTILDTIRYNNGGQDPKTKDFFTYFVSSDRKYAQILGFLEERSDNDVIIPQWAVLDWIDYSNLYPEVVGSELGVLVQESTNIPIQELPEIVASWELDIFTSTWSYTSYSNNNDVSTGTWSALIGMVPKTTCKKVLEALGSADSGIYTINPVGDTQIEVYCDMETDGGGWTYVGLIDDQANGDDISFTNSIGDYKTDRSDTNSSYLLDMDALNHTEMLWLFHPDASTANANYQFIQLQYELQTPWFYTSALTPCNDFLGDDEVLYRTSLADSYLTPSYIECWSNGWGLIWSALLMRLWDSNNWVQYDYHAWGLPDTPSIPKWFNFNSWLYVR